MKKGDVEKTSRVWGGYSSVRGSKTKKPIFPFSLWERLTAGNTLVKNYWDVYFHGAKKPDIDGVINTGRNLSYEGIGKYLAQADDLMDRIANYIDGNKKAIKGYEIGKAVNFYNCAIMVAEQNMDDVGLAKKIRNRAVKQFERLHRKVNKTSNKNLPKIHGLEGAVDDLEIPYRTIRVPAIIFLGLALVCIALIFIKPTGAVIGVKSTNIFGALAIIFGLIALYFIFNKK